MTDEFQLTPCQARAIEVLDSGRNVFLSGEAGTGKSFLIQKWVASKPQGQVAITASTGVAALLAGGRTIHSFFGVGKGDEPLKELIYKRKGTKGQDRVRSISTLIIDELSMIGADLFNKLEVIARYDRESDLPWGGLQIIGVGDVAQLPPVNDDFCFKTDTWRKTRFKPILLRTQVRSSDEKWASILKKIRYGDIDEEVEGFLDRRSVDVDDSWVRVLPRKADVSAWNKRMLFALGGEIVTLTPRVWGQDWAIKSLLSALPVPEKLQIAIGAYVMFRVNDPELRYANGTTGYVVSIRRGELDIALAVDGQPSDNVICITPHAFKLTEGAGWGEPLATVYQFPIQLSWAITTHKTQGATLARAAVDLSDLWEPGQAYVACSRVRKEEDIAVLRWSRHSFISDPSASALFRKMEEIG